MKVQKKSVVGLLTEIRVLYIMMMCCFVMSAEDVMSQSFLKSSGRSLTSSQPAAVSFSSTSSYLSDRKRYSSSANLSGAAHGGNQIGASYGIYTSTRGLRTTSAKKLHTSLAAGQMYKGLSVGGRVGNTANAGASFSAMSLSSPVATQVDTYNSVNDMRGLADGAANTATAMGGTRAGRPDRYSTTGSFATRPATLATTMAVNDFFNNRRMAPPNAIVNAFASWLNSMHGDESENSAWLYDIDDETGTWGQGLYYYDGKKLEELWSQYCAENNMPNTFDVLYNDFLISQQNGHNFRLPLGEGLWTALLLAAVYALKRKRDARNEA